MHGYYAILHRFRLCQQTPILSNKNKTYLKKKSKPYFPEFDLCWLLEFDDIDFEFQGLLLLFAEIEDGFSFVFGLI